MRPYLVQVPNIAAKKKLPVLIFLHGNGGNPRGAMNGFVRRHPRLSTRYILVFPEGYQRSWNIVAERSKADDLGFIESIVKELSMHDNVQADHFSIMGVSNGAALVNQIAIESQLSNLKNLVTSVSPLNAFQHDGRNFKARGNDNRYLKRVKPKTGRRILNISGTEDRLVPYLGGPSRVIPGRNGKLGFIAAEKSIFLWAQVMGYEGKPLEKPTNTMGNVQVFSYLGGDVIHYKVLGEGHGATGRISEQTLLDFLDGK